MTPGREKPEGIFIGAKGVVKQHRKRTLPGFFLLIKKREHGNDPWAGKTRENAQSSAFLGVFAQHNSS